MDHGGSRFVPTLPRVTVDLDLQSAIYGPRRVIRERYRRLAFPPIHRRLGIDQNVRGISFYRFAATHGDSSKRIRQVRQTHQTGPA